MARNNHEQGTLFNMILRGPTKLGKSGIKVTTTSTPAQNLPQGCNPVVYLTSVASSGKLAMPVKIVTHTPSSTATNPVQGPVVPREGDFFLIMNKGANAVALYQGDGTTTMKQADGSTAFSLSAGYSCFIRCMDPTSDTAGYEVVHIAGATGST